MEAGDVTRPGQVWAGLDGAWAGQAVAAMWPYGGDGGERGYRDDQTRYRADREDLRLDERGRRRALPGRRHGGARQLSPDQLRRPGWVDAPGGRDPRRWAGSGRGDDDHR